METRLNDVVISRILALYTRSRMTRVLFALSRISRNLLRLPESHPFPGNPRDAHPPSADAAESARSGKRLQSTATNIRNLMRTPAPLRSAVGPAIMFRQPVRRFPHRHRPPEYCRMHVPLNASPSTSGSRGRRQRGASGRDSGRRHAMINDLMRPNLRKTHARRRRAPWTRIYRRAGFASERQRFEHLFITL